MNYRKIVRIVAIVLMASAAVVGSIQISATPATAESNGCLGSCLAYCIEDGGNVSACWSGCKRVCPR